MTHASDSSAPAGLLPALLLLSVLASALSGCGGEQEADDAAGAAALPLETKADSVAARAYHALGGPEAWDALPYLRFDFASERDGRRQPGRRHLWNRRTGDYRIEWTAGADSNYVALFNVDSREGQVHLNGAPLDSLENREGLQQAYRSFINDTYWLLAPTKMFDPGVQRAYAADSSDAGTDVVQLSFQDVGLTPGDRYWIYVDKNTGRVERWHYVLQSGREGRFNWTGYEAFETEAGPLTVATRKEALGQPFALLTDRVEMPDDVPQELFSDPSPRL